MKQFLSIIITLALCPAALLAQGGAKQTGLDPTVEVITDYHGKVMDAPKVNLSYTADSMAKFHPVFTYQSLPLQLPRTFDMQPIPAARMEIAGQASEKNYGYFRGGLAYPWTPALNLYLHTGFSARSTLNFYLNHRSFWGKLPLYKETPVTTTPLPSEIIGNNSHTAIGIGLQHFWKETAISANVAYKNRYHIFYGQDTLLLKENLNTGYLDKITDDSYMKDKQAQTFHSVNTAVSFYSLSKPGEGLYYQIGASYDYIKETAHRQGYDATAQSLFGLNLQAGNNINDNSHWEIQAHWKGYNRNNADKRSDMLFDLVPAYNYYTDRFRLSAGLRLEGVKAHNFSFNIYPEVTADYTLIERYLTTFLSAGGGTSLNNYEKITTQNPYVLPGLDAANSRCPIDLRAGIRGAISNYLSYRLHIGYAVIDSMYFFTNSNQALFEDTPLPQGPLRSNFDLRYDNVNRFSLGLDLTGKLNALEGTFKAQYNHYGMNNEESPWHLPAFETGLDLRYTALNQLILDLSGYYRSTAPVRLNNSYPVTTTTTTGYLNLDIMAEYRFNTKISAYIQASNLLNNNYQQYYLYYNPGLTIGAGFSVIF